MTTFDELEDYFDDAARMKIRLDFDCKCVLCKTELTVDEGHFIPLLRNRSMVSISYIIRLVDYITPCHSTESVFKDSTRGCSRPMMPRTDYTVSILSPNEVCILTSLACQTCAHKWMMTTDGDESPLATLVPCKPLMLYVLGVLRSAKDEASSLQTLDEVRASTWALTICRCIYPPQQILEDLERDPQSTPERLRASPFLYCYQLHPVLKPSETIPASTTLLVQPSSSVHLIYDDPGRPEDQGSRTTQYCIIEHDKGPAPIDIPSRPVPLYGQGNEDAVTLWRIPMRSPGLLVVYAGRLVFERTCNPELYELFVELCIRLGCRRMLLPGYVMADAPDEDDVFRKPNTCKLCCYARLNTSDSAYRVT